MPYSKLPAYLSGTVLEPWLALGERSWFDTRNNGDYPKWRRALDALPALSPSKVDLHDAVCIGSTNDCTETDRATLESALQVMMPWRKGPFSIFGIDIDTEWRSDWKWQRVLPHIQPLAGRRVLDIGCGNGYHGWRMRGAGADFVLGIDPTLVSVMQFQVMQRYLRDPKHHLLPLGVEDLPANPACFDTVFSMGVLYHRRSPLDHLLELKGCLRAGGQLILETLIVEGDHNTIFMPQGRYAKMRNVWFLPAVAAMLLWLQRCGFTEIACVDTNRTTIEEQRRTQWMTFESLADYLDPQNPHQTIEGYPAPLRAIFIATKP